MIEKMNSKELLENLKSLKKNVRNKEAKQYLGSLITSVQSQRGFDRWLTGSSKDIDFDIQDSVCQGLYDLYGITLRFKYKGKRYAPVTVMSAKLNRIISGINRLLRKEAS